MDSNSLTTPEMVSALCLICQWDYLTQLTLLHLRQLYFLTVLFRRFLKMTQELLRGQATNTLCAKSLA